jgi:DNA-binding Lrp family transcriptional regulator
VAPCHRRLRELERTGAIRGYRAVVDPAAMPGVQRLTSTIVMKRIVEERPFPLSPHAPRPDPSRRARR